MVAAYNPTLPPPEMKAANARGSSYTPAPPGPASWAASSGGSRAPGSAAVAARAAAAAPSGSPAASASASTTWAATEGTLVKADLPQVLGCAAVTLRIGISGGGATVDRLIDQAVQAEEDGFTSIWYCAGGAVDPFVAMPLAGRATSRIEVGSSIVQTYPRHPVLMAQQAAGVAWAVGDPTRVTLGIGVSHSRSSRTPTACRTAPTPATCAST